MINQTFKNRKNKIYNLDMSRLESIQFLNHLSLNSAAALGISHQDDFVQLDPFLKSEFDFIQKHYEAIGLEYAQNIIWDLSPEVLLDFPEHTLDLFMFDKNIHKVRPDENWLSIVEFMDNKNSFFSLKDELDLQVPHTLAYSSLKEFNDPTDFPQPYILKKAISAGGNDIFLCNDHNECRKYLKAFKDEEPFQIQQKVETEVFYNITYEIDQGKLIRLGASHQLIEGTSHVGNVSLDDEHVWEYLEPICEWMQMKGMQGNFGFDVAVIQTNSNTQYKIIECNPRYNGATLGHKIASKLGIKQWRLEVIKTEKRSLDFVDLNDIKFDNSKNYGVVIINWGKISQGSLTFLIAGTPNEQVYLKKELLKILNH